MQDFSARRNYYCFLFTLLSFDLLDSFRFSFVLRICLVLRIFVHDLYMPPRSLSADIDGLMSLFRFGILDFWGIFEIMEDSDEWIGHIPGWNICLRNFSSSIARLRVDDDDGILSI